MNDPITTLAYLGVLCSKNHEYENTGKTLRYAKTFRCIQCVKDKARRHYEKRNPNAKIDAKKKDKIVIIEKQEKEINPRLTQNRSGSVRKPYKPRNGIASLTTYQVREKIFEILGNQCVMCGYSDKRALQIDHINGGGNKERKSYSSSVKYYQHILEVNCEGYQILCANCNQIKRYI